jgi:hypothetical protein
VFRKTTNDAGRSLCRLLADALRVWWQQDRIRISPNEGRLLRLQIPCILTVNGNLVELTGRTVFRSSTGNYVVYRGVVTGPGFPCELAVWPEKNLVRWTDRGGTRSLDPGDVEVFQP